MNMKTIEVGVLGGTGMVGQHFIRFLEGHPWFKLTWLGASDRSAGKKLKDATSWRLDADMPAAAANLTVSDSKPGSAPRLVFSAMVEM
jgi:aspartate-semialdehyde dehydrogenase